MLPLIGKCGILPVIYVADCPDMCTMDVGCRALSEKPEGTPDKHVIL